MKKLVLFSLLLAAVVIILGAYTRLTDAGLGCPDWPGCYGNLTVPLTADKVEAANTAYPDRPVEAHKAWNEMIHRYFAGALGLCILAIAIIAIKRRGTNAPFKLPLMLVVLVIFQAALGMWTVTLNLLPVVVMGHLLGGFSVLACLFLLYLYIQHKENKAVNLAATHNTANQEMPETAKEDVANVYNRFKVVAFIGLGILVVQIALGGWTSANYAALACTEMPVCEDGWQTRLDFSGAYSVPDAENYEYGAHGYGERVTMHIVHRFGALVTFTYLFIVAVCWLRSRLVPVSVKKGCVVMLGILSVQVVLGISNVLFSLPLLIAVMHNGVAAMLLLSLIWLTWSVNTLTPSYSYLNGGHNG